MKSLTRTRSVGGSLVVTIPKEIVREEGLKSEQLVELEIKRPKKSYFGVARGVGPFTKEDELEIHD